MVMCATGNLALRRDDFTRLANGAYLASVTSSEDELELDALTGLYEQTYVADHVTRYATMGHYFYVLAGGNAVNFLHGASVGAFIFLVQAEILAAVARLVSDDVEPGYHEVPEADRRLIAQT
jgi:adenosylhomocysteinase